MPLLPAAAILAGLLLLLWSADRFVTGAAGTARHFGLPPLVIGMVVVGFGTSAPELLVSVQAALQGNPGIALGNAYGSNISNIALILGLTAVIRPVAVQSAILRKELPLLLAATALAAFQLTDNRLSRADAIVLLLTFAALMLWSIRSAKRSHGDPLAIEVTQELKREAVSLPASLFQLFSGLIVLILSARILVWGAVEIAHTFGVSDLIIGLTIVAIGTSLPELASSIAAVRRGEDDIAVGNVIGSNLFNTLAVVGLAGAIHPLDVSPLVLQRDLAVTGLLTLALLVFGSSWRGRPGRINRWEGSFLLLIYLAYNLSLLASLKLP